MYIERMNIRTNERASKCIDGCNDLYLDSVYKDIKLKYILSNKIMANKLVPQRVFWCCQVYKKDTRLFKSFLPLSIFPTSIFMGW